MTPAARNRIKFVIRGEVEVIGGDRAEFGGERAPPVGAKLVGVQFERVAESCARCSRMRRASSTVKAVRSQKTSQKRASSGEGRQHLVRR